MEKHGAWVGFLVVSLLPATAAAQSIPWQHNYAQGWASAATLNRPMMVNVGGDNCIWCRKMDALTYSEPGLAATIQQQFVPLRVHGQRDASVVAAMNVQTYPTTIFATPGGKILHAVEGFVDAPTMYQHIQIALWRYQVLQQAMAANSPAAPVQRNPVAPGWGMQAPTWNPGWPTPFPITHSTSAYPGYYPPASAASPMPVNPPPAGRPR